MNKEYMKAFREARADMGFSHTSAYVPSNRLTEFSMFVDRLKAERMVEICEKSDPHSRERRQLANRNMMELPSREDVNAFLSRYPNQPAVNRQVVALVDRLEQANSTLNVAKNATDSTDILKWMSWAVAHNHMANLLWREMVHSVQQLEARRG